MREDNYIAATRTARGSSSRLASVGLEVIRELLRILFSSLARGSVFLGSHGFRMNPTPVSGNSAAAGQSGSRVKRLNQSRSWKMSSWTAEIDHDREWELRKDKLASSCAAATAATAKTKKKMVGRCVSDCTGMRGTATPAVVRTRSLTDADLDELRGCIDLGFGFKNEADPELWETLPALELCYAISQQFKEVHGSPASSFMGGDGSSESSEDSSGLIASPSSSWQIASPGDQEVKTRLRHWARAVACTVRQTL